MEDGTPWEDINPPMASAKQPGPLATSSGLEPATKQQFGVELTACLALVVPVGMTEESRREWLSVAWETLKHLPPDLLAKGCREARLKCEHPSKIVPTIIEATREWMATRRESSRYFEQPQLPPPPPEYCTPEQARAILEEVGLKRKWDGSGEA